MMYTLQIDFDMYINFCVRDFFVSILASKRKGQLPPMENRPKQEDILNAILPPREWAEQGKSNNLQ